MFILQFRLFLFLPKKKKRLDEAPESPFVASDKRPMKNSNIPEKVRKNAKQVLSEYHYMLPFGCVTEFPASAIEIVTDGSKGKYKAGLRGWIIGGNDREIFVGTETVGNVNMRELAISEFTVLLESGCQFLAQYGRDFRFV